MRKWMADEREIVIDDSENIRILQSFVQVKLV